MKVVLFQPQIPQNTGNIVRTCSVTGSDLVLIPPCGFSLRDARLKRAGLDYWEGVCVSVVEDWETLLLLPEEQLFFFSSKGSTCYAEGSYTPESYLFFGSENTGLPPMIWERFPHRFFRIPMHPQKRCLNLATSVGICVYEAWRQNGFFGAAGQGSSRTHPAAFQGT